MHRQVQTPSASAAHLQPVQQALHAGQRGHARHKALHICLHCVFFVRVWSVILSVFICGSAAPQAGRLCFQASQSSCLRGPAWQPLPLPTHLQGDNEVKGVQSSSCSCEQCLSAVLV